jgi:hypothetical protein
LGKHLKPSVVDWRSEGFFQIAFSACNPTNFLHFPAVTGPIPPSQEKKRSENHPKDSE